jgi:hypothetical protein
LLAAGGGFLATLWQTRPAAAVTYNCRDVSTLALMVEAADTTFEWGRVTVGMFAPDRRNSDVISLLSHNSPGFVQRGTLVNMWASMMCLARQKGDPSAIKLQQRWSNLLGWQTDGFSVPQMMNRWLDRLRDAPPDQRLTILSPAEWQLISDTAALVSSEGDAFANAEERLRRQFPQMPPPFIDY